MIKIKIDFKLVKTKKPLSDRLAKDLGGFLIIPSPGAAEIPFGMVSLKCFQFSVLFIEFSARLTDRITNSV